MSWIHNLFEMFKKEEEIDGEVQLHNIIPKVEKESSKDLDARITYQYPKGHFRFPVIPDNKKTIKDSHENSLRKKQPEVQNNFRHETLTKKGNGYSQKEPVSKRYSNGPFRPTEIPSPIFGFNRPKKAAVEHELTHFSKKTALSLVDNNPGNSTAQVKEVHEFPVSPSEISAGSKDHTLPVNKMISVEVFEKLEEHLPLTGETFSEIKSAAADTIPVQGQHSVEANLMETILELAEAESSDEVFEQEKQATTGETFLEIKSAAADTIPVQGESSVEANLMETILEFAEAESSDEVFEQEKQATTSETFSEIKSAAADTISVQGEHSVEANLMETILELAEAESSDEVFEQEKQETTGETFLEIKSAAADTIPVQGEHSVEANLMETILEFAEAESSDEVFEQEKQAVLEEAAPANGGEEASQVDADITPHLEETVTENETPVSLCQEKKEADISENTAPKKSPLPFNVLMLKQDKQRWTDKSKTQKELQPEKVDFAEGNVHAAVQHGEDSYRFPSFQLLKPPVSESKDTEWLLEQENLLNQTLANFNVGAKVVYVTQGPSVTRFEVQPEPGVKVNKVTNLADDIKLSLAAREIRIEAPIPGKHTIGIEVPNQKSRPVLISEIIKSKVFSEPASPLTAVLGLDISGKPIVTDLKKMPHGLIAGATGSGKSVCINSILISLLYKASPEDLKLLLIDPKMVELAPYNQIPHLVSPVITDVKAATAALKWAVDEMERRYELFAYAGVRDISRFNEMAMQSKRYAEKLPFIVIVIDELADLMMMSPADVEEAICRIAQKARACGIHLIVATQRPSVDVITGLIKANIPTRIAFSVSSQIDSRTIIDISGAEKLLGRGDMLFLENGSSKPLRLQGTFVSDEEIDFVAGHVREQREPDYLFEQEELLKKAQVSEEEDELFYEACEFVVDQNCASTSSLQRRFKIGYNRAARLMDLMEQHGYISGAKGSKPRDVLITEADLGAVQEANF